MKLCKDCEHFFFKSNCLHPTNVFVDPVSGAKRAKLSACRNRAVECEGCTLEGIHFERRAKPTTILGRVKEFFLR